MNKRVAHIRTERWLRPRGLEPALQKDSLVYTYIHTYIHTYIYRNISFFLKFMSYCRHHYHLFLSRVYLDICDSDTTYVSCVRFSLEQGLTALRTASHCLCTNVECICWRSLRIISGFTTKFRFWWRICDCVYRDFRIFCWWRKPELRNLSV